MTARFDGSEDARALDAFSQVIRNGVEERTAAELDQGLKGLSARMAAGGTRRRRMIRWSLVGAMAALGCVVVARVAPDAWRRLSAPRPPSLVNRIEGGRILEGGYLRESGHGGIKLFFNEGSKLVFMPGARGRLRAVGKDGARVAIEQGTASFQVMQGGDRRWLIEVGPFLVTVKGTVFTVSWDPSSERFELNLRHGRVVVSGPVSGEDIALRAGQRLLVDLPRAETLISEEKPEEAPADSLDPVPARAVPASSLRPPLAKDRPVAASTPSAPATVAKSDGERRWSDEWLSGHWDGILADVERGGIEAALEKASSEDLFALANAARYRRRTDLARAALLAERRRFPASPRAIDAIFLLGRVEEARERGTARAIAWYDEYLARAPTGPYAAEALGRKMTLTSEIGGRAEVRPIAEDYLHRFPRGSYAGSARALLAVP